ncbi:M56 family metallopeptidase [Micromonospora sp. NPDC048894]|uniref:M56 family metallopeptidase n=1 Tax=unclassified Micromonospora TaxID=2617518 RepID=UPI0033DE3F27
MTGPATGPPGPVDAAGPGATRPAGGPASASSAGGPGPRQPVGAVGARSGPAPDRLGWWYLLVVAALGAVGVGAGDLYFLADRSLSLPWAVAFDACERAFGATTVDPVPPGFTDCLAEPTRQRALVLLVAVAVVLGCAAVLLVAVPAVDLWRLRRRRRFTVGAAAQRFAVLCAAEGLTGRDRPRLLIAGPPVRQAFTVGVVGRRPIVVLPVGLALAHRDPRRFDPVVRHELAHVRARDVVWVAAVRALVWLPLPAVAVGGLLEVGVFGPNRTVAGAFLRAGLLATLVAVLSAALLRARERAADRQAARDDQAGALTALLRADGARARADGGGRVRGGPARAALRTVFARHPTPEQRIRSLRESSDRRGGEVTQGMAVGAVTVVSMAAVHELVANAHYPALGWLPRLVDVWVAAVLLVGGLFPSLLRRATTAHRSATAPGWWRPVAGTGLGLFGATLVVAVLPLPGSAGLFLAEGAVAGLVFAAVTGVLGAGAVALCVLVASALADLARPRTGSWRYAGHATALAVTVAVLWPVPGLPPLWSDPELVRIWLAYDLPDTGWLLLALGLPVLLGVRFLVTARRADRHHGGSLARRMVDSTRVRVVAVAVLVGAGGAVGQLRFAPPGTLDEAVGDAQARGLLTGLVGVVVLVITAAGSDPGPTSDPGPASPSDPGAGHSPAPGRRGGVADRLGGALLAATAATLGSALVQYLDAVLAGRSADGSALRLTVGNPLVWLLYLAALVVPVLLPRAVPRRMVLPTRLVLPAAVSIVLTVTVLVLGPGVPGVRVPVPTAGTSSASRAAPDAPTPSARVVPDPPPAAGRRLTAAEARVAVDAVRSALPTSWESRPVTAAGNDRIEPTECVPLARDSYLDRLRPGERARAAARYATPRGRLGIASTTVEVGVTSYVGPVGGGVFAAAETARAACRRFVSGGVRFTVGGRPAPALGEQSWRVDYALAVGSGRSRITGATAFVLVRVGHNLVAVSMVVTAQPLDERLLTAVVTTVVGALGPP